MTQYWDDFSTNTLPNYTEGDGAAFGAPSIVAGNLRLTSVGSSGGFPVYYLYRSDLAAQADWEAAVRWRFSAATSVDQFVFLYLRANNTAPSTGYFYGASALGARSLFRQTSNVGPAGTTLGATVAGTVPAQNTYRGIRMRVVGGDLKAKDWAWDANDPPGTPTPSVPSTGPTTANLDGGAFVPSDFGEPAWTLERTDASPLPVAGRVGLGADFQPSGDGGRYFEFDFLSITNDPAHESANLRASLVGQIQASRWKVYRVSDNVLVYDSGVVAGATTHTATGLAPNTAYYAKVSYQDIANAVWSAEGVSAHFTTQPARLRIAATGHVYAAGVATVDPADGPLLRLSASGDLVSYGGATIATGATQASFTPDGLDCVAFHPAAEF